MKTVFKILLLLMAVGYLGYAVVRFAPADEDAVCRSLYISIDNDNPDLPSPIDTAYLRHLLVQHKFFPEGQRISSVSLSLIDSVLNANPYIRHSLVYFDANDRLCIEVVPNNPVMHIIPEGAPAYYLGADGEVMPDNMSCQDLPLASGYINQSWARANLSTLARIMAEDGFWNDIIGQIYVNPDSTVVLIPRLASHSVYMGRTVKLRDKLDRLKTFYTDAMPQVGWNVYDRLNLEYDKQIIATRKNRIK